MAKTCLPIVIAAALWGCATAEIGRQITPDEVAWIQKGISTRSAVVQRFGHPMAETPDWTAMQFQTTSTTTTTATGESQQSVTTTKVEPINKVTKAIYLHTKSEGGLFVGITTTQEQFWIRYDEQGIVQDHGFQASPGMQIR